MVVSNVVFYARSSSYLYLKLWQGLIGDICDNAKRSATTASHREEEIRVQTLVRDLHLASRCYNFYLTNVVNAHSINWGKWTVAASMEPARDADSTTGAAQDRETIVFCELICARPGLAGTKVKPRLLGVVCAVEGLEAAIEHDRHLRRSKIVSP